MYFAIPNKTSRSLTLAAALAALVAVVGCTDSDNPSKQDVAERAAKGDLLGDPCADFGWYGDGVCDGFCPLPDPDCGECPDPADPAVHYVSQDFSECAAALIGCDADQAPIDDACGCGCVDQVPASCPDPSDPSVHYVADSDQDPDVCAVIRFTCEDNQTLFSDAGGCGCGCIDEEPQSCPDPSDPSVHYIADSDENPNVCAVILFGCDDNQTLFSDSACGCGCIDEEPQSCPDPADPAVHYIADSDQNPDVCTVILFACEDNQVLFSDGACGCGCIDE